MPPPDSRIRRTGRSPDTGLINGPRARVARDLAEARDLAKLMHIEPPEHRPGRHYFSSIDDAAGTLGLNPVQEGLAGRLIGQVAKDAREALSVAKAAREGGIPAAAIPELLRRGMDIGHRHRMDQMEKGRGKPVGTHSKQGGIEVVKQADGQWVPAKGGKKAAAKVKGKQRSVGGAPGEKAPPSLGGLSDGRAPKAKAKPKAKKPKAQGKQPKSIGDLGDGREPGSGSKDDKAHPDVEARYAGIQAKAKAAGKKVEGDVHGAHGHEHMDQLDRNLDTHIAGGADPADAVPLPKDLGAQPAQEEAPTDDEGRPVGHDEPGTPHEEHRLLQQVHDLTDKLDAVEKRLDSPHQKGMFNELQDEAKATEKKPSPQAVKHLDTRILSFIAMITGIALGAAVSGDISGALAGGTHGKATKVAPGAEKGVMDSAREAAGALQSKMGLKAKPKEDKAEAKDEAAPVDDKAKKEKPPAKLKKGLFFDPSSGRMFFKSAALSGATPTGSVRGIAKGDEELEDPTEDVPDPVVIPVGFAHGDMSKAGGWASIPGGHSGGQRRRKASGGWEYQYHEDGRARPPALTREQAHHAVKDVLRNHARRHEKGEPEKWGDNSHSHDFRDHDMPKSAGESEMGYNEYEEIEDRLATGHEDVIQRKLADAGVLDHVKNVRVTHGEKGWFDAQVDLHDDPPAKPKKKVKAKRKVPPPPPPPVKRKPKPFVHPTVMDQYDGPGMDAAFKPGDDDDYELRGHYIDNPQHGRDQGHWAKDHPKLAAELASTHPTGAAVKWKEGGKMRYGIVSGHEGYGGIAVHGSNGQSAIFHSGNIGKVKLAKGFSLRAAHPINRYGHRDDLEPDMILQPRTRHAAAGQVEVLPEGKFLMKGTLYTGGHALLTALHKSKNHRTTVRRYFKLGGEREQARPARLDPVSDLRALMKSRGIIVQRLGDEVGLSGDLAKAEIPAYLIGHSDVTTRVSMDAAADLVRLYGGAEHG